MNENLDRKPRLTPGQLCFTLNYMLGLPVVIGKRSVIASEIPVLVVGAWNTKTRKRAERWVECEMRRAHMLPKIWRDTHPGGRPASLPFELVRWVPGRRAA